MDLSSSFPIATRLLIALLHLFTDFFLLLAFALVLVAGQRPRERHFLLFAPAKLALAPALETEG